MWFAFYVATFGHFASKKLALPMLLLLGRCEESRGEAFIAAEGGLPEGRRVWLVWDEAANRHCPREILVCCHGS